jgi:ClpP class serine protease
MTLSRRAIRYGEAFAIDPRAIQRDADGIFVLFAPDAPENEYANGVACVHIRGPLDHHAGYGDNYDAIRERARQAFECDDAETVIFRIDSPGGAVSGLYDTVRAIRGMAEASGKRTIAYVDERAFSAAYALSCACEEIVLPESGLCGSIGVISTMADQVKADKMHGLNFVTITSGDRKADGHIHVPISDDAIEAERRRVDTLALQFFQAVKAARGLPIKAIRGFQAGLFLGAKAVTAGVADRVMGWDQLFAEAGVPSTGRQRGTTVPASGGTGNVTPRERAEMNVRGELLKELRAARAALASASTDVDKATIAGRVAGLEAAVAAYKRVTEKHVEHSKTQEEDEEEDEEGNETDRGDDEKDDEKKEASSKKSAKAAAEEDDEEEEASAEDEEEAEAKALLSIVRGATGKRGAAAAGAVSAMLSDYPKMRAELAAVKRVQAQERVSAKVDAALGERRITKREAKTLRTKPMAHVEAFLEARPAALFAGSDDDLARPVPPQHDAHGNEVLPPDLQKQLDQREDVLKDFSGRQSTINGARSAPPRE